MTDWRNRIIDTRTVTADELHANPSNWRKHPDAQAKAIRGLLSEVGIVAPLIAYHSARADGALTLIDGHMRQETGGAWPVTILDVSDEEADLILATFDPITGLAEMDANALGQLLGRVEMAPVEDEGVKALLAQLAQVTGENAAKSDVDAEAQVDRSEELRVKWGTATGQVWQIAQHFVICGDCREPYTWRRLLDAAGTDKVNGVFTSPPYAEQRKEQYGGTPADEYVDWWESVQANVKDNLAGDGSFFVNIKPHTDDAERSLYVMDLVIAMARKWAWSFVDEFCWLRSGVPREVKYSFKNGFEPVYHFAARQKGFLFRPEAVRHKSDSVPIAGGPGIGDTSWAGRQGQPKSKAGAAKGRTLQGNPGGSSHIFGTQEIKAGLAYPSNVLKASSNDEALGHQAAFPVDLPDFFIRAYSDIGDAWLDPFLGSGTTIVAAHQNGRVGLGIEMLPKYMGVILERLQEVTQTEPKLLEAECVTALA